MLKSRRFATGSGSGESGSRASVLASFLATSVNPSRPAMRSSLMRLSRKIHVQQPSGDASHPRKRAGEGNRTYQVPELRQSPCRTPRLNVALRMPPPDKHKAPSGSSPPLRQGRNFSDSIRKSSFQILRLLGLRGADRRGRQVPEQAGPEPLQLGLQYLVERWQGSPGIRRSFCVCSLSPPASMSDRTLVARSASA